MGSNFVQGEASHVVSFDEYQEDYFNNIDHSLSRCNSSPGSEAEIVSHHQERVDENLNVHHLMPRRTSRRGSESEIKSLHQEGVDENLNVRHFMPISTSGPGSESEIESLHQEGVDEGHLAMMRNRISSIPLMIPRELLVAGNPCIFRLPERFKNINGKSYEPQMVSIGPYHRGKPHLQIMEEFKWQCLAYFLKRPHDLNLYMANLLPLEMRARNCYSETINNLTKSEFLEIMLLDGCFILELLRFLYSVEIEDIREVQSHPLARMGRLKLLKIYKDLLLLENQIPSFVLLQLFQLSRMAWSWGHTDRAFSFIGIKVFSAILGIRYSGDKSRFNGSFLHLLDMVRSIFIPPDHEAILQDRDEGFPLEYWYKPFNTIPSVSKLRHAGIKVNPRKDCFLVAEFLNGAIEMPNIILNDLMCSLLVNCVAFEQSYNNSSKHFSVYALFLDCLVNTVGDVEYLCDRRVIDNYIGTNLDAAGFINILGKDLTFDIDYFNLWSLFFNVNEYYRNRLNRHWTSFRREYFNKPWLWISALVALVLFVLTFLQTFFTIYAYVHPKN
ncbi:UPF0481 protein At3g47200-like [Corylus avellana]|uniref:UPF0481 protein At3g47200-like n=1 Tax=Corylus avellana TaxID=13451 RepID=UPI001E233D76|nr:UPF0481 protein At3g47200-like [Corylus avellana]